MGSSGGSWQQSISAAFLNRKLPSAEVTTGNREMQRKHGELYKYRVLREIQQILYAVVSRLRIVMWFRRFFMVMFWLLSC